jgi:hypothetical protein
MTPDAIASHTELLLSASRPVKQVGTNLSTFIPPLQMTFDELFHY